MPTPSSFQTNSMPIWNGNAVGVDGDGFISNPAIKFRVVAKTADYTVKVTESGTIFTNAGATAAVNFTLPATASCNGCFWIFAVGADQTVTVTAGTADTMVAKNDIAADSVAFSTASLKVGGAFMVFGDGTYVYALPMINGNTITVATA